MVKEKTKPKQFVTDSNIPVKPVYYGQTKNSKKDEPGKYPFTRGIHPGMYRDRYGQCVNIPDSEMLHKPTSVIDTC